MTDATQTADDLMREASTLIDRRVMHLPAGVESGFSNHLVECIVQAAVLRMTEDPATVRVIGELGKGVAARDAELELLRQRLAEMEARAVAALWLIPDGTICGDLQALRDKAKRLLAADPAPVR